MTKLKLISGLRLFLAYVRPLVSDLAFFAATAFLARGAYLIYRPAAWVVMGIALLVISFSFASDAGDTTGKANGDSR